MIKNGTRLARTARGKNKISLKNKNFRKIKKIQIKSKGHLKRIPHPSTNSLTARNPPELWLKHTKKR